MNILPKKRWHVRNRENIARVRRDEAKAAEEEKQRQERVKLAEQEARRELLLSKSRGSKCISPSDIASTTKSEKEHVNFFKDLEENVAEIKKSNKEHDKEQREEKEKYEKQIGYLTYLGQDTNEATGKKNWYDILPDRSASNVEVNMKSKLQEDPLEMMKKYLVSKPTCSKQTPPSKPGLDTPNLGKRMRRSESDLDHDYRKSKTKKKHKKKRESSSDDSCSEELAKTVEKKKKLELLRQERLKRERDEKIRTQELLSKIYDAGGGKKQEVIDCKRTFTPKYNSQFNPELAKQNYSL